MSKASDVQRCCVARCPSTSATANVKMFEFPNAALRSYQRNKWIQAIRYSNSNMWWTPERHSVVCSEHFVSDMPSRDSKHRDYVPSMFSNISGVREEYYEVRSVTVKQFALEYVSHPELLEPPTLLNVHSDRRRKAYAQVARRLRISERVVRTWETRFRDYYARKVKARAEGGAVPRWLTAVEARLGPVGPASTASPAAPGDAIATDPSTTRLTADSATGDGSEATVAASGATTAAGDATTSTVSDADSDTGDSNTGNCTLSWWRRVWAGGLLAALCSAAHARGTLCSTSLYTLVRSSLRLRIPLSELHALWVGVQRAALEQVGVAARAGDAPAAAAPPHAARVADLVLLHTDVPAQRLLDDESVTLYEEAAALHALWQQVQSHAIEDAGGGLRLARRWSRVHRDYCASGRRVSLVVLQRRWHELKLQARHRLAAHWRSPRPAGLAPAPPASVPLPAPLHLAMLKRYPHIATVPQRSWVELVSDRLVVRQPLPEQLLSDDSADEQDSEQMAAEPTPPSHADASTNHEHAPTSHEPCTALARDAAPRSAPAPASPHIKPPLSQSNTGPALKHEHSDTDTEDNLVIDERSRKERSARKPEPLEDTVAESADTVSPPPDHGDTIQVLHKIDPTAVTAEILFDSDDEDSEPPERGAGVQLSATRTRTSASFISSRLYFDDDEDTMLVGDEVTDRVVERKVSATDEVDTPAIDPKLLLQARVRLVRLEQLPAELAPPARKKPRSRAAASLQWGDPTAQREAAGGAGGAGDAGGAGGAGGAGEAAMRRVLLSDIEQVRRRNQQLLTAQVRPIPAATLAPGPAEDAAECAGDDLTDDTLQLPCPAQLPDALAKLSAASTAQQLMDAPYCCAARRHRAVNDTRRRIGMPPINLHKHAGGPCTCCCVHLCERAARRALLRQLAALHRDLSRVVRTAEPNTKKYTKTVSAPSAAAKQKQKHFKKPEPKSLERSLKASTSKSSSVPKTGSRPRDTPEPSPVSKGAQPAVRAAPARAPGQDPSYDEWLRQKSVNTQYFNFPPPLETSKKKKKPPGPAGPSSSPAGPSSSPAGPSSSPAGPSSSPAGPSSSPIGPSSSTGGPSSSLAGPSSSSAGLSSIPAEPNSIPGGSSGSQASPSSSPAAMFTQPMLVIEPLRVVQSPAPAACPPHDRPVSILEEYSRSLASAPAQPPAVLAGDTTTIFVAVSVTGAHAPPTAPLNHLARAVRVVRRRVRRRAAPALMSLAQPVCDDVIEIDDEPELGPAGCPAPGAPACHPARHADPAAIADFVLQLPQAADGDSRGTTELYVHKRDAACVAARRVRCGAALLRADAARLPRVLRAAGHTYLLATDAALPTAQPTYWTLDAFAVAQRVVRDDGREDPVPAGEVCQCAHQFQVPRRYLHPQET